MTTYEKEEGDIDGPFDVGVIVTESVELTTAETKLALFSSSAIMDESADQMISGGNSRLFMNAISWMCGHTTTISVPVKSLSVEYLTVTTASSNFWSILVIGIIPGVILIGGLVIWLSRRKQ